jgi:hypothetical protein
MEVDDIPWPVTCELCGQVADVVMTKSTHGEQLVIVLIDGKLYVTFDCPTCGRGQQEVGINSSEND